MDDVDMTVEDILVRGEYCCFALIADLCKYVADHVDAFGFVASSWACVSEFIE